MDPQKAPEETEELRLAKPLPEELFVDHSSDGSPTDDPGGGLGSVSVSEAPDLALNAETRWEAMAEAGYLTPTDRFFVRNHAHTPRIVADAWELRVEGPGVEEPLTLGYEDLLAMPDATVVCALECAGNGRVFFGEEQGRPAPGTPWRLGAVGVAEWRGVPLREVLKRAGLKEGARSVMVESLDAARMRRPLPVEKALEDDVLLAYGMNGEPLPPDHGHPVRVVVPRWAAVASVKWVGRLYVAEEELRSPWDTEKYVMTGGPYGGRREPVTAQVPKSAVELPWPARLGRGRREITGRSWSPHGAIQRVEYSVSGGPWREAELFGPNVAGAWARWRFLWTAWPGEQGIRVRATDKRGNTQPEREAYNELGYLYGAVVEHPVHVS